MLRKTGAYGLIGGCFAGGMLLVLLCMSIREAPRLAADILACQATYPALAELPDFDWVSVQPDGSLLLHKHGEPDQSAALPEDIAGMLRQRDLLGLRKSGDDVFFTIGGAADDEWGYIVTGDESVCMEGLWHVDRISNSVYRFSTMK